MKRSIKSNQRQVRLLALRIEGSTGTPSLEGLDNNQCTIADNGTGDYTITFNDAFAAAPHVVACAEGTNDILVEIDTLSASSVRIKFTQADQDATYAAPAAIDVDAQVLIIGSDITDRY